MPKVAVSMTKDAKLNIQYVKTADLIPYARNARTHSDIQVRQIARSMERYGWTNPVLVDGNKGVIAGHGRLLAAQTLGWEEVPVIRLDGMSDADKRAYILADNRLAESAGWDKELLKLELGELKDIGYDVSLIGFSLPEMDKLFEGPDSLEDVPEELPGAQALKDDMDLRSKLMYSIPEFRTDMLSPIPNGLRCWAGPDATPDDGESFFLWIFGSDTIRGLPTDRFMTCFYTDDYRFDCMYTEPSKYVGKLLNLGCRIALSPNYSIWSDDPIAVMIYSTYRARWVGRYLQEAGIAIIPDVNWATPESYEFCFLGIPKNAPAISVQLQTLKESEEFDGAINGLREAMNRLEPQSLLVYGSAPARRVVEMVGVDVPVTYVLNRSTVKHSYLDKKRKGE
jgi:hypothetical protein